MQHMGFGQARATTPGTAQIADMRNANVLSERQPQVQDEIQRLNATLEALFSTVERLEHRLQPVTLPRPEDVSKGSGQPEEMTCSVAGALRNIRQSIEAIGQRLNTLTNSLEI